MTLDEEEKMVLQVMMDRMDLNDLVDFRRYIEGCLESVIRELKTRGIT